MPNNRRARWWAIYGLLVPIFLTFSAACALFPGKKSQTPYTKADLAKLSDKDVYVIDGEKYIKVPAGKDPDGNTKFTYVKVDRYLKGEVEPLPLAAEQTKKKEEVLNIERKAEEPKVVSEREPVLEGKPTVLAQPLKYPYLKRKIAILPFENRTTLTIEKFGEVIADRLAQKMEDTIFTCMVLDRETVRRTLERAGLNQADLKDPRKSTVLNRALGVQGIIVGAVYGPFVTTTTPPDNERFSTAVMRISARFIDTAQGRLAKEFTVTNSPVGSEEFGVLSEEKAKYRAADLIIDDIIAQVVGEINGMDWFARVALVEGNTVYLNVGFQTGLKKGDLLEVYPAGDVAGKNLIGKLEVSKLFGVDAAVAHVIKGNVQKDAIVRPPSQG
jgi:hypothetical protein